jgi:hypothetical protein
LHLDPKLGLVDGLLCGLGLIECFSELSLAERVCFGLFPALDLVEGLFDSLRLGSSTMKSSSLKLKLGPESELVLTESCLFLETQTRYGLPLDIEAPSALGLLSVGFGSRPRCRNSRGQLRLRKERAPVA